MRNRYILYIGIILTLQYSCTNQNSIAGQDKPNIILIMADDMGYSDLGCYGAEIATPHIDALASDGIRFTNFYNAGRCCPTRASLLTGLYPHQTGIGHMTRDYEKPGYRGDLNQNCVTIAEVLKAAGYHTGISGKWHVTKHTGYWDGSEYTSRHNWPLQRGFEKFYGFIHGSSSYFDPVLTRDNEPLNEVPENYYLTDAISDHAVGFLEQWQHDDAPFFLYISYNAPHWPMHALPEDIAKYKDMYRDGWEALRQKRYTRMKELGVIDKNMQLSPLDPENESWQKAAHKEWQIQRMAVYAAMIDRMDQGIGRVLDKLAQTGDRENTLIFFLADNGGSPETIKNPRKFYVPRKTKNGHKVHRGTNPDIMPGADTTFQSYGIGWANASNVPFRLFKRWTHEGGIATPLIIHWPAMITKTNSITDETGHVIDIMATCLDAAGADYPAAFNGHEITALEGKSLLPVLNGADREGHPYLYWEHEGNRAIRRGNMKLVSYYSENRQKRVGRGERTGEWELYDMQKDRIELNNLAAEMPDVVTELEQEYIRWSQKVGVIPWEKLQELNKTLLQKENKNK